MGEKQELFPVLRSHFLNLIHWLVPDFFKLDIFLPKPCMDVHSDPTVKLNEKKNLTRPCQHIFMGKTPESLIRTLGSLWGLYAALVRAFI